MPENNDQGLVFLQPDWKEAFDDGLRVWIRYKAGDKKAEDDKLEKDGNDVRSVGGMFEAEYNGASVLRVRHIVSGQRMVSVAPVSSVSGLVTRGVTGVEVSTGGLGVVTSSEGSSVTVWETDTGKVRRQLEGHLGQVYTARMFPSGVVVLSSGADMRLKIWSATTGECPVTLTGHTQAVTDTAIVGVGKNIISVSKDGSVRLWSCGERRCVGVLTEGHDRLNCCDITDQSPYHPLDPADADQDMMINSGEHEKQDKVLAVGGEDGTVLIINVAARKIISSVNVGSPVNSVKWSRGHGLYIGTESGKVHTLTRDGLTLFSGGSSSPVLCLSYSDQCSSIIISRQDGTVSCDAGGELVTLAGADHDPVYSVSCDSDHLYTGCRDGLVRKYSIKTINNCR